MNKIRIAAVVISVFIALVFLSAPLPGLTLAKAGSPSTITMSPSLGNSGTLNLTFILDSPDSPISGVVDLNYNSEYLKDPNLNMGSPSEAPVSLIHNANEPGILLIAFANPSPIKNGEIFTVTFTISEDCPQNTTFEFSVNIENCELIDNDTTTVLDLIIEPVSFKVNHSSYIIGDVNMNGVIESADATLILRHIVGLTVLSGEQLVLADCNCSDSIEAGDATIVLRIVVGLS